MVNKSTTYFETGGDANTDDVIRIIRERLREGDIKSVVVASTSGKTGLRFARALGKEIPLVVVSSKPGGKQPGVWLFDLNIHKELQEMGIPVLKQSHVFSGLERSFTQKFSGLSRSETVAEALKSLFSQGTKVAIECAVMALDAGAIPIDKVIAVGSAGAKGGGADTALVVKPSHSNNFFDFRVLEILAKPFFD
jgi:hypothetical protein